MSRSGYRRMMYDYRMNRATFALWVAVMIVMYTVMIALDARPPGIEIISSFAIVPRLHDLGRSGWWFLLVVVLEILAVIIGASSGGDDGMQMAGGVFIVLFILCAIVLGMIPGQAQPNRWGDPPPRGINKPTPKPASLPDGQAPLTSDLPS